MSGTLHQFFKIGSPPPKRKKTESEKQQKRKEYEESQRKRDFQHSWLQEFHWLTYDGSVKKMYCKVCKEYESTGSFVTGSTSFTKTSVKAHEKADGHKNNVQKLKAKHRKPGTSQAERILETLSKDAFDKLSLLFRSVHSLAKHARPFTDFTWMCELDVAKGLKIGLDYRNDKQAAVFSEYIAKAEISKIQKIVEEARFISLISDGSTDSSFTEAEIVYLRFCHMGKIQVHFVAVKNVSKGDSLAISDVILKSMEQYIGHDFAKKVVSVGTDGASVMTGCKTGVVVRIKQQLNRPFIVGMHCCGHRLELAYKDALKDVKLYKKIDALLLGLYYFYRNSPLNRSNLKESFKTVGLPVLICQLEWVVLDGLAITKGQLIICYVDTKPSSSTLSSLLIQQIQTLPQRRQSLHRKEKATWKP